MSDESSVQGASRTFAAALHHKNSLKNLELLWSRSLRLLAITFSLSIIQKPSLPIKLLHRSIEKTRGKAIESKGFERELDCVGEEKRWCEVVVAEGVVAETSEGWGPFDVSGSTEQSKIKDLRLGGAATGISWSRTCSSVSVWVSSCHCCWLPDLWESTTSLVRSVEGVAVEGFVADLHNKSTL
ncbi:hypothetical protein Drorol1_Dr00024871 [Drosera rotundifolia]